MMTVDMLREQPTMRSLAISSWLNTIASEAASVAALTTRLVSGILLVLGQRVAAMLWIDSL